MSEELYKEIILDHYQNPRNKGELEKSDIDATDYNPLCGDKLTFKMVVDKDIVTDIKFSGDGCAISQATASILTEILIGKTVDEISKFDKNELLSSIGMPNLGPVRIKCALLSLKVAKLGTFNYLGKEFEEED